MALKQGVNESGRLSSLAKGLAQLDCSASGGKSKVLMGEISPKKICLSTYSELSRGGLVWREVVGP
jgi:hypothetical protein